MFDIEFYLNGKKINPANMTSAVDAALVKTVEEHIRKKVGSLQCPDHNKGPKIIAKGNSLDNLSYEIQGCCQNFIDTVKAKF
jgi:hypothetical protein